MPTYIFDETWDRRPASTDTTGGQSLTRTFEGTVDSVAVAGAQVIGALAALKEVYKGAAHPDYALALCTRVEADVHPDDPFMWVLTATYAEPRPVPGAAITAPPPPPPGSPPAPPPANQTPENRPPQVKVSFRREPYYVIEDLDGQAIENSVGDKFDDPPPTYRGVAVVTSTRDWPSWNAGIGFALLNNMNASTWNGFAAQTCLITGVEGAPVTEGGYVYWRVTTTIEVKPEGWLLTKVLNLGWNVIVGGVKQPARSVFGDQLASPVKLDNVTGAPLDPGDPPQTRIFRLYDEVSFDGV